MGELVCLIFYEFKARAIFALVFLTYNSIIKKNIKCIVFMTNEGDYL